MKQIRSRAKDFFVWYFVVLEMIHFVIPLNWGDDKVFFQKANSIALLPFLKNSSRVIIDTVTYLFAKQPLLWRVTNPIVLIGLTILLCKLLQLQTQKEKLVLSLLILYPSMALVDAGFMATTLNYLWPFAMGAFVFYCLHTFHVNQLIYLKMLLSILALLYASSMQQTVLVLFVVLCVQLFMSFKVKNTAKTIAVAGHLLAASGMALFLFYRSFFAENARFIRESAKYFPDFAELSVFQKVELGFSSTFHGLTSVNPAVVVVLLFCVFIFVISLRCSNKKKLHMLSAFPIVIIIFVALFRLLGKNSNLWISIDPTENPRMELATYHFSIVEDIIYLFLASLIFLILLRLITDLTERIIIIVVLFSGMGTRMLMGFSPTVWASGYRTFFIFSMALLIVAYRVYKYQFPRGSKVLRSANL
jgi:hypothetical protein